LLARFSNLVVVTEDAIGKIFVGDCPRTENVDAFIGVSAQEGLKPRINFQ
jgi:hypothetical protein